LFVVVVGGGGADPTIDLLLVPISSPSIDLDVFIRPKKAICDGIFDAISS
jgi:hypothetical protein